MKTNEEKTKTFIDKIIILLRECDSNSEDFANIVEGSIRAGVKFGQNMEIKKYLMFEVIVKEKIRDLQFALNSVCYDVDIIQKLEQVWDKFNLLKELIENSNNENS
jgi:hypothetical protein